MLYLTKMDKDIQKLQICDDCSMGPFRNLYHLFLGQWCLEVTVFLLLYSDKDFLASYCIQECSRLSVTLMKMLKNLDLYEDST